MGGLLVIGRQLGKGPGPEVAFPVIRELERRLSEAGWRELALRERLEELTGEPEPAPNGAMTAQRIRALEDAVDAARQALRPGVDDQERHEAVELCELARRTT